MSIDRIPLYGYVDTGSRSQILLRWLTRLKGEMDAIETTSRRKGCNIHFETREAQKAGNKHHKSAS